jgi:hypothetical protein
MARPGQLRNICEGDATFGTSGTGPDMYSATLSCGMVLAYEALSMVPDRGESVPCRRHGYCIVQYGGNVQPGQRCRRGVQRAAPRHRDELFAWLRVRSVTTIHTMRRQRFTLRMIAEAEREGLVTVDVETGMVTVHHSQATRAETDRATPVHQSQPPVPA